MTNKRKLYQTFLMTMVMMLLFPLTAAAEKVGYAVYDPDIRQLTFYYDEKPTDLLSEYVYDLNTENNDPGWINNKIDFVIFDESFKDARPTSCYKWFWECNSVGQIDGIENLNTSEVTNMKEMFYGCSRLNPLDLSNFDTSKVKDMSGMFKGCSGLTSLNLSKFNTSEVEDMTGMFVECSGLTSLDLKNFNTSNVGCMTSLFSSCSRLESLDLTSFDTSRGPSMQGMFWGCSSLTSLNLTSFNTSNVGCMENMFYGCSSLKSLDLTSFNTSSLSDMSHMFYGCSILTTIYVSDKFTTDNINNPDNAFLGCKSLVGAIDYSSGIVHYTGANYYSGYFTYGIKSADDLASFAKCVNTEGKEGGVAVLLNDITMTAEDNFTPITCNYTGKFDGQGHTISGLNLSESKNCLFAQNGGTIKNLGVVNATIAEGATGSICQTNSGTMEKCFFMATTTSSEGATMPNGAVCQTNNGTITRCYYLASNEVSNGGKTAEQFEGGAVCYLLNGGMTDGTQTWYQNIDNGANDAYPVIDNTHGTVYPCTPCTGVYSNTEYTQKDHEYPTEFDGNGFMKCSHCEATKYQPAMQNEGGKYEIGNAGQLYWFAGLVNGTLDGVTQNKSANAVLTNNITVNEGVLDENGEPKSNTFRSWTPICVFDPDSYGYDGTFEGNNKTISGLYFNDTNTDFIGLFGDLSGTVKNVGVADSYFNGKAYVGGVCGNNRGGTIQNCYNTATVNGTSTVGGVCGYYLPNSRIINCYNVGAVSGTTNVGGVCGLGSTNGTITNCYYLASKDDKNGGKEETQFKSGEVAFLLAQGCTVGETFYDGSVWGQQLGVNDYPVLDSDKTVYRGYKDCLNMSYSNIQEELSENPVHHYYNGFCEDCNVYQPATLNENEEYEIGNAGQLCWFAGLVNGDPSVCDYDEDTNPNGTQQNTYANAVITDNITFTGNFTAIGNSESYYSGTFDGKGHTVKVNQSESEDVALFGQIGACTIKNMKVKGTINTPVKYAAGFAMHKQGTGTGIIENCISDVVIESTVKDDGTHGGIIGMVDNGTLYINNCAVTGAINGASTHSCGGIVGWTEGKSYINNTYVSATFTVSSDNSNIVSRNEQWAQATNCYYVNPLGGTKAGITQVDADDVTSGKLCMTINSGTYDGSKPFGQQLGTDNYPVPGSPYKLITTAEKTEDGTYWATFSDQTSDVTLSAPSTRTLKVYNATVSAGTMTLTERNDGNQVAKGEGVLLKTDGEYVNVKANETNVLTKVEYANNNLVATPATAQTVTEDDNKYTLYRLTYNDVESHEKLGFYLSLVKDESGKVDEASVGKQLKATPGKAYLRALTSEAKLQSSAAPARGFAFPGDDDATGIECITVTDESLHSNGNAEGIFDLQGRKVSKPTKGVYIKNNKLFLK